MLGDLLIRFIDIRNQGTGSRFSFWDTCTDDYYSFMGEEAWNNFKEFKEDYRGNELRRFKNLCPEWAFDDKEDDMEKWLSEA